MLIYKSPLLNTLSKFKTISLAIPPVSASIYGLLYFFAITPPITPFIASSLLPLSALYISTRNLVSSITTTQTNELKIKVGDRVTTCRIEDITFTGGLTSNWKVKNEKFLVDLAELNRSSVGKRVDAQIRKAKGS